MSQFSTLTIFYIEQADVSSYYNHEFHFKLQLRIRKRKTNQNTSASDKNARFNIADIENVKLHGIKVCQAQLFPDTIKN